MTVKEFVSANRIKRATKLFRILSPVDYECELEGNNRFSVKAGPILLCMDSFDGPYPPIESDPIWNFEVIDVDPKVD